MERGGYVAMDEGLVKILFRIMENSDKIDIQYLTTNKNIRR